MINDAQTANIIYRLSPTNAFVFFSRCFVVCAAAGKQPTERRKPKPKARAAENWAGWWEQPYWKLTYRKLPYWKGWARPW